MNDYPIIPPSIGEFPKNIKYITEAQLADRWNVSRKYLQKTRYNNTGVPFVRLGKRAVRYAVEEILAYEEACRRTSTEMEG